MKKLNSQSLLIFGLGVLCALGLNLALNGPVLAKQQPLEASREPAASAPPGQRSSLRRAQLEEQLIRSDATAVMLGEWLSQRNAEESSS